jgi:hypothetical protein
MFLMDAALHRTPQLELKISSDFNAIPLAWHGVQLTTHIYGFMVTGEDYHENHR